MSNPFLLSVVKCFCGVSIMKLSEIKTGQTVRITEVGGEGALRQHFLDMGVIPGAEVTLMKLAPMGDPMEFRIHGYELTLRVADAADITVEEIKEVVKNVLTSCSESCHCSAVERVCKCDDCTATLTIFVKRIFACNFDCAFVYLCTRVAKENFAVISFVHKFFCCVYLWQSVIKV